MTLKTWFALLVLVSFCACATAAPPEADSAGVPARPVGLNVRDFGAAGDTEADDTAAVQAALDAAEAAGGGLVYVPPGDYRITETLRIPAGVTLAGANRAASRLHRAVEPSLLLMDLVAAHDTVVRDLGLYVRDYVPNQTAGGAIRIGGGSQRVLVERVTMSGFSRGIEVGRDEIECTHITFRDCLVEDSRNWGFVIDQVNELLIDNCQAFRNGLDGFKLRRLARNVTIRGGESSHNGHSTGGGSGVDGYAGGDAFVIENLLVEHNNGAGIYVKTGPLYYRGFGPVGNGYITGVRARYNRGSGIDLNRSGGDLIKRGEDRLPPLLSHVTISGGVYEENERAGIYVRGRNVTILGPICRRNRQSGIALASAWDVEVIGAQVTGNGGNGIAVGSDPVRGSGHRVRIRGGTIDGIDSDAITDPENVEEREALELAPAHRSAIHLNGSCEEVVIDHVTLRHWREGAHPIESRMRPDASLIVHYGPMTTKDAVGGPGSTLVHDGRVFIKTTPSDRTDGWQPVQPILAGGAEARPAAPSTGQMHFDTARGIPLWWTGTGWVNAAGREADD